VMATGTDVSVAWELVTLTDGSSTQSSGTSATGIASAATTASPTLTSVDATVSMPFVSVSGGTGGSGGGTTNFSDTTTTAVVSSTSLSLTRSTSAVGASVDWFVVSFFSCANTPL